jgi:hypothetical protein
VVGLEEGIDPEGDDPFNKVKVIHQLTVSME